MERFAVTDISVPISCTLDPVDRPARTRLLEDLRRNTTHVRRVPGGLTLGFAPESYAMFEEFTVAEKRCCAFFEFELDAESLVWTAPVSAVELMDEVYGFFSGQDGSIPE